MINKKQINQINNALYKIHSDISQPLSAALLAKEANYSEQHFHRVFNQILGEPVHHYIRRIRLETAANQLMFDPQRPIIEIAHKCGFQSLSSFTKAFKGQFSVPPGQWRSNNKFAETRPFLVDKEIASAYHRLKNAVLTEPELIELAAKKVVYARHVGYGREIKKTWLQLQAWALSKGYSFEYQLGLHHSNPIQVPLNHCRYVACLEMPDDVDLSRKKTGVINTMTIPGGLHARFHFSGVYGELLPYITKVYEDWLPQSGLTTKTTPAFVCYKKNQFLDPQSRFSLDFYLPVSFY